MSKNETAASKAEGRTRPSNAVASGIWPPRQIHLVQTGEGKRYVRVGKRKIKVHRSISNNELIKWVIKHFKPKRRKRGEKEGKKDKSKSTALPNDAFPTAGLVQQADIARSQARETKEKLDKAEADLKQLQLVQAVKEQKAPTAVVPKIGAPSNIPVRKLDVGEHEPIYSKAQARAGVEEIRKHTEAQARAAARAAQQAIDEEAAKAKAAKDEAATQKENARQLRLEKLRQQKEQLSDAMKNRALAEIDSKFTNEDLRKMARARSWKTAGYNKDALLERLLDEANNVLGENEIRAKLKQEYQPEFDRIDAEIAKIHQEGQEGSGVHVDLCNRQSGNGLSDAQIERKMHTGKYPDYWGTMAADEIPEIKPGNVKRVGWIMNTDVRALPGVHWVAFLIDLREGHRPVIEYYDPLADPFEVLLAKDPFVRRDLKALLKRMGAPRDIEFKQNRVADQNNTSNNCGPFAIRFLQQRFKGKDFAQASGLDASGEHVIELWKNKK